MQNSTETCSNQKPVLPQVRYHPSIQTPGPGAVPKTTNKTISSPAKGTKPAHRPHAGTNRRVVQETEKGDSAGRPHCVTQKGIKESAAAGPELPEETASTDAPRPEAVPMGVEVQLDQRVVEKVEVLTRGQRTNQSWFAWRTNRITASMAHCIARCRFVNGQSKTPPSSYLANITGKPRLPQHYPALAVFTDEPFLQEGHPESSPEQ